MSSTGGKRVRSKLDTGQKALLAAIWKSLGGPKKAAAILGFEMQDLINWRNRKKVPLKYCNILARKANLPIHAFNYKDVTAFSGETPPSWESVVRDCKLIDVEIRYILRLPNP